MSEPSKVIILRQENAKLVSEIRDRGEAINKILKINGELWLKVIKQDMVIMGMNRKLAYYENPHSPPSGNIPAQKKKSEQRNISKEDRQNPKPTRKVGSSGVSHHRKSADRCKKCGNTGLTHKKVHQKKVTGIVFTVQTKTHCSYESTCRCVRQHAKMAKEKLIDRPQLDCTWSPCMYKASGLTSIRALWRKGMQED